MICTTEQFADIVGMTPKTINTWISRGMPVAKKGGSGRGNESIIESTSALDWVIEARIFKVTGSAGTPKDRLDGNRADLVEIQIMKEVESLVESEIVEQLYGGLLTQLRVEMQFVGDDIARMIKDDFGVDVKRDAIQNKIIEALQRVYEKSTDEEMLDEELLIEELEREDQEDIS